MNRGQVCNAVIEGCVPLYTIEAISFLFRGSAVFVLPRVAVEYAQPSTSDGASAGFREPESKQSTNDLSECTIGRFAVPQCRVQSATKTHIFQFCNYVYLAVNSKLMHIECTTLVLKVDAEDFQTKNPTKNLGMLLLA